MDNRTTIYREEMHGFRQNDRVKLLKTGEFGQVLSATETYVYVWIENTMRTTRAKPHNLAAVAA